MSKSKIRSGRRVGEIFETKDYSIFKLDENRDFIPSHFKNIKKNMEDKGWLRTSIVTINEKGVIIDGQHRFEAAKETNSPVHYRVCEGAGVEEMTEMNSLQKNWSIYDHLNRWSNTGNKNYITFKEFTKEFPMYKYTEIGMFLSNSTSSVKRRTFESGNYIVKDVQKGKLWANQLKELKPYGSKFYNRSIFVRAMIKIMSNKPEFSFDEFLHKVRLRPMNFFSCGTVDQYIEMIESIYNYRRSNKVNLRF
jgi:hypothetical protein